MDKDSSSNIKLDSFWPYHAVVLADLVTRHTHSVVKTEANLNISQWRVLAAVADKPGRTAADVTNITPMDKTIVSRAVSSLIDAGLIKKTRTKTDKRRLSLEMTPKGKKKYEKIAARLNETLITTLIDKSEDAQFIKIIQNFSLKMKKISPKRE